MIFRRYKIVFFTSLLWAFFSVASFGQAAENFERLTSVEGVHQSIIYSIAQDSFGNIWAGMEEGIVRFNSREAQLYNKYDGLLDVSRSRTSVMFIDSQHRIWAGMEEGLSGYDFAEGHFEAVRPKGERKPNIVKTIIEDGDKNIWLGAFNGIWKYSPGEKDPEKRFRQYANELNINALFFDEYRFMVGTDKGLFTFNPENGQLSPVLFNASPRVYSVRSVQKLGGHFLVGTNGHGLFKVDAGFAGTEKIDLQLPGQRDFPIYEIMPSPEGQVYVATDGAGLFCLGQNYNVLENYANDVNDPRSISSNGIYDMLWGQEDILWIATYGGGINKLNLSENYFTNISHRLNDPNSLSHNFTRSILEDREGNIWFGTKEGISIRYKKEGRWKNLPHLGKGSNGPDIVMALQEDGDYIWAGTYGRGVFKINKNNFSTIQYNIDSPAGRRIGLSKVYAVLIDKKGNCWLGGIDGNVHRISPEGKISTFPVSQVRTIIQGNEGGVLVAGRSGVQKIKDGHLAEIEALKPGAKGLKYTSIGCLFETPSGDLVVGSNGGGVIFYDNKNKAVKTLDPDDGLPSDIVQGILFENEKSYWASTARGLAHISLTAEDTIIRVFNQGDGLASGEYNYGSFAKLSDGGYAFGGVDGVTIIYPDNLKKQKHVPEAMFEDFKLLNEKRKNGSNLPGNINTAGEVKLEHFENAFNIKFTGILHSAPMKVRYSWKMEGLNDVWSTAGSERQINFINLKPDTYIFKVKAANRDGIWGAERQLKIIIAPPWWATNLAYLLYFILAAAISYGIFHLTRILIRKRNADEQIAFFSNITHELKTPLSILLSSLDDASQTSGAEKETNQKIKSTVERLNTLFDQLLNFNKATAGKGRPIEVAKIDLKNHIERVVKSFHPLLENRNISIKTVDEWNKGVFYYDREALDKILFNLISNAIKYSKENGEIEVRLHNGLKDGLRLSVVDNGIGIPKDQQKFILKRYYRGRNAINSQLPGTGLGLMIVKNLVERYRGNINFNSVENKGTTFTVVLKSQDKFYHASVITAEPKIEVAEDVRENTKMAEYSDAKILVVEDNDELRKILTDQISTYFQVYEATNGREGLEMVKQVFPDIILTDYIMPDMDGMELVKALQEDINTSHIPIFMMTVLNSFDHKLESIESGVTAYMEKPIDFDFLLAKITSTLDWKKKMSERYVHQSDVEDATDFRNKREVEFLNNLEKFVLEKIKEEQLSVHDLCRHVGMSRTALYMKLKNMVDLSPQNFIIHTRLRYAKKLLREEGLHVKEVAYMAGFSNPKYFSTSFKKMFGESPTGYMKSLREE